jgi:hypothetical protein
MNSYINYQSWIGSKPFKNNTFILINITTHVELLYKQDRKLILDIPHTSHTILARGFYAYVKPHV